MEKSSDDDVFYCNYNGEKIIVNLYESFKTFKKQCAKALKIENTKDIKFYIKFNDIEVEITNQDIYEENILNDLSIKEVFCFLNNNSNNRNNEKRISDDEEKLLSIIKKLEERVNKLELNNNEILQKNKELENELSNLKNQFENYKKETNIRLNQLEIEKGKENVKFIEEIKNRSSNNELDIQIPIKENKKINKIQTIEPKELENSYKTVEPSKINNIFNINFYSFAISLITKKISIDNIDKKKNCIKTTVKLKNNGTIDFPANCCLKNKSDDNESHFYIKDIIINNGDIVKINQIIDITIFLFLKNKNINNGVFFIYLILYNAQIGIIGKEEKLEIQLFDNK